jgi:hypothetical protein
LLDFVIVIEKNKMSKTSNVPCKFWNSAEGCVNTPDNCKFIHAAKCNHFGCIKREKDWTHCAEACGFLQKQKAVKEAAAPPLTKDDLLQKVYDKTLKKIAGKIVGMFAQAYDIDDLQAFLDKDELLVADIKLACQTLADAEL